MREISRLTKISGPSVINHLKALVEEGLIIRVEEGIYPSYIANRDSELFKLYKKHDLVLSISESGFLKFLKDKLFTDTIVLFGSASRGEDIEKSDIDIFVLAKEKKIDLKKYEKVLDREINLFFSQDFTKLSHELKNNILNGVKLDGYLKVY